MMRNKLAHWRGILSAAGLGLLALMFSAGQCGAGLLTIPFDPNGPDVTGSGGSLTYNATTGELQGTLTPAFYSSNSLPGPNQILPLSGSPSLSIDLFVNPDGTFKGNGTGFELSGSLSVEGTTISGVLLSGSVSGFGADSAGPPPTEFDGLFTIDGGPLTQSRPLMGGGTLPTQFPIGSFGGFDLVAEDAISGILGDFQHDFSSGNVNDEAGLVVPEPSSWALTAAGLTMLLVLRGAGRVVRFSRPAPVVHIS
jgi:hypothetical protein